MLAEVWLGGYLSVITHPLCNCLVKKIIICVPKHVRKRLVILTCGKNNHKMKIAGNGQLAVGLRPLDYKYTFLFFPKMLMHFDYCLYGGGGDEKKGTGVKLASYYY